MKNILEYIPFLLLSKLVQLIGYRHLNFPTKILYHLFYYLLKIRREIVYKNLMHAFPDKSLSEHEQIAKKCYYHFSKLILEIMCIPKMKTEEINDLVKCQKLEELKSVYEEGRGLIFLTAHIGNWEYGAISVPSQMGTRMYPIVKSQRNPYVTKWLNNMRETHGNEVIKLGISVRKIFKVIKEGHLLGVVGDQRGPKSGRKVKLFGMDTTIYSGTAEIVSKTLTPLYILFAVRDKHEKYYTEVEEISLRNLPENKEDRVNEINQRFADLLEEQIRKTPEQWFWMHNIWKYNK